MDKQSENVIINDAKGLAKFFQVSVCIKIFGHTIFEWVWPPQSN